MKKLLTNRSARLMSMLTVLTVVAQDASAQSPWLS